MKNTIDMTEEDKKRLNSFQRAQERVEEMKNFYTHLIAYLMINPFLILVNYFTYWDFQWFWFPLFGWGLGLAAHALTLYGFGSQWEEQKIRRLMEEDKDESTKY